MQTVWYLDEICANIVCKAETHKIPVWTHRRAHSVWDNLTCHTSHYGKLLLNNYCFNLWQSVPSAINFNFSFKLNWNSSTLKLKSHSDHFKKVQDVFFELYTKGVCLWWVCSVFHPFFAFPISSLPFLYLPSYFSFYLLCLLFFSFGLI